MTEPRHIATIYTVGHSNRSLEQLIELLLENEITLLADVRRFPASRRFPHFNADQLAEGVALHGIGYRHFLSLGGRRGRADPESPNDYWRVESFRAYADYSASDEGKSALRELIDLAGDERIALLCSEAVPWRCHRRLIADLLVQEGYKVIHITGRGTSHVHEASRTMTQLGDGSWIWPAEEKQGKLDL